jgi:large subunit ribosomal protein L21
MSIIFEIKGKQYQYIPTKKDQTFRIDYQKNAKDGEEIIFDKVLSRDEEFGQPYLKNVKLVGKITKQRGLNRKITGMKYKAKKRNPKKWGHRQPYTEIEIVSVEEK